MILLSPALVCLGLAFIVLHVVRVERKLSAFPGPFVARFTDYWKAYHLWKGDYSEVILWWHKHHGDIIRIGPHHLSIGDATEVPHICQINPILQKANQYKVTIGWLKGKNVAGLESMLDEKQHTNVKRMMAPSFALSSVMKNYESKLNDCAEEFIEKITQMRIFDITEWFSYYTMDSMNSVAFSANLGLMKHATDIGSTLHFLRSLMSALIYVIAFPQVFMWLSWAMSYLVGLNGPLVTLARSRVESRFDQADLAHGDLLDGYLQARRDHPEQISSEQVLGMTLSTILAGSDSTAFTLMWTLHYLLQNPQALKSVKEEIAKAVLEGNLNYPPALKELVKLPYLQATIKEGLRCSAVFRLGVQRISPKGGIKICDRHVPEGITVGCYQEVVHRDRTVYGDDAASFRPDRWLEASEIDRKMMERCGLWYGSGKHACIGQHFAQAQMLKVLAMMIMKLEISAADPKSTMVCEKSSVLRGPPAPHFLCVKSKRGPSFVG